jgi:hypothetical protein
MFTHCFVCNARFPPGKVVEHFPVGRRIAYDMERGRLWAICDACGGWTLAPLTDRWEAMEELERLVTAHGGGRARLAGKTQNVALFKVGAADIIRIGHTKLIEEAEWRYGRATPAATGTNAPNPFAPRRLSMGEWLLGNAYLIRSGMAGKHRGSQRGAMRRWVRFGDVAWRGQGTCRACGLVIRELTYFDCRTLILKDGGGESLTPHLVRACPRCKDEVDGGLHLEGTAAEFVLRRVLAHQQDRGNPPGHLRAAAHLIEMGGGPTALSSILARYGRYLSDLPITSAVALRVLANDAYEQRMLGLEATSIERQWRHEEELASIIDGDLSHAPTLEAMRLKMRGL